MTSQPAVVWPEAGGSARLRSSHALRAQGLSPAQGTAGGSPHCLSIKRWETFLSFQTPAGT